MEGTSGRAIAAVVLALACVAPLVSAPSAEAARTRPLMVGIGDQGPSMFQSRLYRRLGLPISRLMVPWNAAFDNGRREWISRWLAAAKADGVEPLVAFTRFSGMSIQPPSVAAYRRAFRAFRAAFPQVRDYIPWNEENHQAQPTFRRPARAAAYYKVMLANCPGCRIVAADVLDTHSAEKWLKAFIRALHGPMPQLWGLHNYMDANRHHAIAFSGTTRMLDLVRGEVWLTEVGGLVKSAVYPYDERRAARAIRYLFTITHAWRTRITRVYIYNWAGVVNARQARRRKKSWDSGLMETNGKPRPGYFALRSELQSLRLGCWSPGALFSSARWLEGCA